MVKELWISWKDLRIPVEVLYSARKTFGLEVTADLKVRARVPKRASDRQIKEFAEERKVWIVEKYLLQMERAKKKQDRPAADYEKDPKLEKLYREKAREPKETLERKVSRQETFFGCSGRAGLFHISQTIQKHLSNTGPVE